MRIKRTLGLVGLALTLALGTVACSDDADVVSENLSKDADNFKIQRRVIFYNGINGEYIMTIEGLCSVDPGDANRMTVTCKTGADEYKKHFLGKSDNVTWFAEQLEGANVSPDRYKVTFKPSTIIPDPQLR